MTVEALTFDVFGTVVDWRSTVIREGAALGRRRGLTVDWEAFADAWRGGYRPAMERVRSGDLAWTSIDDLHRMILDRLLEERGIADLPEEEIAELNRVWQRLEPWPDAVAGLERLRRKFIVATLSNGNVSLLVRMAKRAGLTWDAVLSAELVQRYKPDPAVYRTAARLLGCEPRRVLMVAAHAADLRAAAAVGFRTAFVARPVEWGPQGAAEAPPPEADLTAGDFLELADRLGA